METEQELETHGSPNVHTENDVIKGNQPDESESKAVNLIPPLQSSNININESGKKQNSSTSIENIGGSGERSQVSESSQEKIDTNINDNRTKQNPSTSIENIVGSYEAIHVSESSQKKENKETGDWEVVEVSSNASLTDESSNCDVIIPLKQLEKDSSKVQGTSSFTRSCPTEVGSTFFVSKVQDTSNKNKNIPTSSQMEHNPDEDSIVIVSDMESISPQSTNSKPSQNEIQKTNTETATKPKNVTKKRKFKLFTGDSSDDGVDPEQKGLKGHAEKEISTEEILTKDLQPEVEENNRINKNNETFTKSKSNGTNTKLKNNETFAKSNLKFLSDTELTDDNFPLKHQPLRGRPHVLPQLPEESDSETEVVPHNSECNNSQIVQSRKTLTLEKSSRRGSCQCSCSSVPLVGSPNAKRIKRQRLMNQMLQERERKLKRKMVKKMKDVFVHVLESLVESSDDSDILSESDDQTTVHLCKIAKRKKSKLGHSYSNTHQYHSTEHVQNGNDYSNTYTEYNGNEPKSVRDLKLELHYWKHKAKSNTEEVQEVVLTPEEIQTKKMKDELNYWKKLATSQSKDLPVKEGPMSSTVMTRTSTPVKQHREESRSTARHRNEMTEVPMSSSCYSNLNQSEHVPSFSQTELRSSIDYLNEDKPLSSQTLQPEHTNHKTKLFIHSEKASEGKKSNPFQRGTLRNAASISQANNTVSITSRVRFTEKEKNSMIEYLVKNYDTLELIKGNMFWMQMANDLDTQRTWQSLKNNFFQCIMKNLEQYEMPAKVRNKIILLAKQYM